MKLSDFKRLPVGTKLLNTHSLMGPTPETKQLRVIAKLMQSFARSTRITAGERDV